MAKLDQSTSLIDLSALPHEVAERVRYAMVSAMDAHSHDGWMRQMCQDASNECLIAAGEKEYPNAPIGLSIWYDHVDLVQETVFNRVAHNGARRPVFMRGAKNILIRKYCLSKGGDSPNGWAARVFWRAVRMAKITSLDQNDFRETTRPIYDRLCKKYYLTAPFDRNVGWDVWGGPMLVGGRRSFLEYDQIAHIKSLKRIAARFDSLDKKRAAIKTALFERLAA